MCGLLIILCDSARPHLNERHDRQRRQQAVRRHEKQNARGHTGHGQGSREQIEAAYTMREAWPIMMMISPNENSHPSTNAQRHPVLVSRVDSTLGITCTHPGQLRERDGVDEDLCDGLHKRYVCQPQE